MPVDARGPARPAVQALLALSAVVVSVALCGCCPSFSVAVAEFDSVAGWRAAQPEPELVAYSAEAERMPWAVRQLDGVGLDGAVAGLLGIEPTKHAVTNPSEFARDCMACFVADAIGDPHSSALALVRLVWVLDGDAHSYNQLQALQGIGQLADWLDARPLTEELAGAVDQSEEALTVRWQPYVAALRAAVDFIAADTPMPEPVGSLALAAVQATAGSVPPAPRDRRVQLLLLSFLSRRCPARELRAAAVAELAPALRRTAADALRRALFEPRSTAVRELAVRTCYRLEGDGAVPRILRYMAVPGARSGDRGARVELDPALRLSLVRLCGQLPESAAVIAEPGAAAPVEFLYDTIADSASSRALRVAALEALARCLGKPIDLDRAWADAWWTDFVVRKGARA
jgi:hypothetical protein